MLRTPPKPRKMFRTCRRNILCSPKTSRSLSRKGCRKTPRRKSTIRRHIGRKRRLMRLPVRRSGCPPHRGSRMSCPRQSSRCPPRKGRTLTILQRRCRSLRDTADISTTRVWRLSLLRTERTSPQTPPLPSSSWSQPGKLCSYQLRGRKTSRVRKQRTWWLRRLQSSQRGTTCRLTWR